MLHDKCVETVGLVEYGCLLGCSAVKSGRSLPKFQILADSIIRATHRPDDGGSK
jgi:hypothetical protein